MDIVPGTQFLGKLSPEQVTGKQTINELPRLDEVVHC